MWIEKTKNGKYQFRESYTDPLTGRKKSVSVVLDNKTRLTQKLAQRALDEKIRERIRHPKVSENDITFEELRALYIEWQHENLKHQTALTNENKLGVIGRLLGEQVVVNNLTARYVKERLKADRPCTFNDRIKNFKAMIRWAYRNDLVTDIAYLDKIRKIKDAPVRVKDEGKYLEHDEIDLLLEGFTPRYRLLTQFLILSGLRIGELLDLEVRDIDYAAREIDINSSYSFVLQDSSSTKTETSARTIYIQDELLTVMKSIDSYRHSIERENGMIINWFFPNDDGGRLHYYAYAKYLKENSFRLLKRVITPHALRHTHTALMASAGIPLEQIARRLGHSDSRITKEVYFHVTEKLKDLENARLKEVKLL